MAETIRLEDPLLRRAVPAPDPLSDFFWHSGADGKLRILRCGRCGFHIHPPSTPCPRCLGDDVAPAPVSGLGVVQACTVNVQEWISGQPRYSIAIVELVEQPGLRLTSNVLGCEPEAVHIGQHVRVNFIARNGIHYPVFTPASGRCS
jgi:uncharacterized OB-fold protein